MGSLDTDLLSGFFSQSWGDSLAGRTGSGDTESLCDDLDVFLGWLGALLYDLLGDSVHLSDPFQSARPLYPSCGEEGEGCLKEDDLCLG